MKGIIIALLLIGSFCFSVFAEEDFILSTIIGLNLDDDVIKEKIELYNKLKMDAAIPMLLNGIIGFGSGSFMQNDILFGIIGFAGDTAGISLLSVAAFYSAPNPMDPYGPLDQNTYLTILYTGWGVYLISKFIQLLRAGTYTYDYNKHIWNSIIKNID